MDDWYQQTCWGQLNLFEAKKSICQADSWRKSQSGYTVYRLPCGCKTATAHRLAMDLSIVSAVEPCTAYLIHPHIVINVVPYGLWPTLRKVYKCINIYIYIFIKVGLAQHAWTMAACKTSTMSIWVAKSLYLTGSWSLIDCNVVSFGGFKLIKHISSKLIHFGFLFKTPWLEGNLKALKSTSHQYPLICWQHSNLWCQVSGMSQIFKHPKLNGVLTAWDGTGCMA